jgi:hypothetical protein
VEPFLDRMLRLRSRTEQRAVSQEKGNTPCQSKHMELGLHRSVEKKPVGSPIYDPSQMTASSSPSSPAPPLSFNLRGLFPCVAHRSPFLLFFFTLTLTIVADRSSVQLSSSRLNRYTPGPRPHTRGPIVTDLKRSAVLSRQVTVPRFPNSTSFI